MEETGQGTDLIALTTTSSLSGGIFLFFFWLLFCVGKVTLSLVELLPEEISNNNLVDRYILRLLEHVRKQILPNRGRVQRFAASDVVLPGAWSSKRVCYRGNDNNNNNNNNVVER